MKKAVLFFTLILISFITFGQVYFPLVEEGKVWSTFHNICLCGGSTEFTKFEGDTLINGKTYKIVWTTNDTNLTGWDLNGQIREENFKVYYGYPYGTDEFLIYDFLFIPGDTLYLMNSPYPYIMDSVGMTTLLNGEPRPVYYLTSPDFNCTESWIEGVGSNYGILNGGFCGMVGDDPEMICFTENGVLKYQNSEYEKCYVITSVNEPSVKTFSVYPNPVTNRINVEGLVSGAGRTLFELIDLQGTVVFSDYFSGSSETFHLSGNIRKGVYAYRISRPGILQTGKVVVIP